MSVNVLLLQAKWQFFDPLQAGKAGLSPNRCSTDSWFIARSKVIVIAWLVATSVASRPGEMLTMRGGLSAQAQASGANNARIKKTPRRMPGWKVSEMGALRGPAAGGLP